MTTIREKNANKFKNRLLVEKQGKYSLIGEYKTSRDKALIRHNVCGYEWYTKPANLLNAKGLQGCPRCQYNKKSYSTDEFKKILNDKFNGEFIMKEGTSYIRSSAPLFLTHLVCGKSFKTYWGTFGPNGACPYCKKTSKKRMTNEEFLSRVSNEFKDEYIFITEYSSALEPVCVEHKLCGERRNLRASHIMYGDITGCPYCESMSMGENLVKQCLKELKIKFIYQKRFDECKNIYTLPFDFYLPDYNVAIEYDGIQHFSAVKYFGGNEKYKRQVDNDNIKSDFCNNSGIRLLRINYKHNTYKDVFNIISNFL